MCFVLLVSVLPAVCLQTGCQESDARQTNTSTPSCIHAPQDASASQTSSTPWTPSRPGGTHAHATQTTPSIWSTSNGSTTSSTTPRDAPNSSHPHTSWTSRSTHYCPTTTTGFTPGPSLCSTSSSDSCSSSTTPSTSQSSLIIRSLPFQIIVMVLFKIIFSFDYGYHHFLKIYWPFSSSIVTLFENHGHSSCKKLNNE